MLKSAFSIHINTSVLLLLFTCQDIPTRLKEVFWYKQNKTISIPLRYFNKCIF